MKKTAVVVLTILIVILACCASWVPAVACAEAAVLPSGTADTEIGAALDAFLQEYSDNHAAVATVVFRGETDIYTRYFGYYDMEGQKPLDADCVLEWGSTSKLLVWVSVMQLVENNQIDLSADIRDYLPQGFLHNLRYDAPITMLNLMNHNAGFQDADFALEVMDEADIVPLGEFLRNNQPTQVFAPNTVAAYSNWGAALAGYIVECIAGVPFWQYVQTHIFAPLGMTHSALAADLGDNPWVQAKRKGYPSYMPNGELFPENKMFIQLYPSGMCTSTLSDFATFAKALLVRDEHLLSAAGYTAMYSASLYYTDTDKARIAHGFLVDYEFSAPIVGHDGNTAGGSSRLLLDMQNNVGMVVMTNQLGGSLYRTKMAKRVFGESEYHIPIDGYYGPARAVFSGKQKFYSLFLCVDNLHITSQIADGLYINVTPDRMEVSATDYLLLNTAEYRLRDAVTIIWFVLLAYAAITFVAHVVMLLMGAIKRKPMDWLYLIGAVYALSLVLSCLALLPSIPSVLTIVYQVVLGVATIAFVVILALRAPRKEMRTRRNLIDFWRIACLILCYAFTIINVVVWDLMC